MVEGEILPQHSFYCEQDLGVPFCSSNGRGEYETQRWYTRNGEGPSPKYPRKDRRFPSRGHKNRHKGPQVGWRL